GNFFGEAGAHYVAQRIHRRIVDRDDRDTALIAQLYRLGHGVLPTVLIMARQTSGSPWKMRSLRGRGQEELNERTPTPRPGARDRRSGPRRAVPRRGGGAPSGGGMDRHRR